MRITVIFQLLLLSALLLGCEDDNTQPPVKKMEFVPGQVAIGIKSEITIDQVFDLMNEKEVFIEQMNGFFYYSTFSNDSLDYVREVLSTKEYTDGWGPDGGSASIFVTTNRITVTEFFFNMDLSAQEDWLLTLDQLHLEDLGNVAKDVMINVAPGTEKLWLEAFREHPYVEWVELNYIGGFYPTD